MQKPEKLSFKDFFLNQYKELETRGPFRKRQPKEGNNALMLMDALANRWRRYPDSEGKRLVSKILTLYDTNNPLLGAVLIDDPALFEQRYQEATNKSPLYWLEITCLIGQEKLMNYFINTLKVETKYASNLLAYGLSVGNADFAYKLANFLQENDYTHPECLSLYNRCKQQDLQIIKSMFQEKSEKNLPSKKMDF